MTDAELKTARRVVANLDDIVNGSTTDILIAAAMMSARERGQADAMAILQKGWKQIYSQVMVMEP